MDSGLNRKNQVPLKVAFPRSPIRRLVAEGQLSWQFPAGKVEPGETTEDAAVRETFEEVGLTIAVVDDLGGRTHPLTGRSVRYFGCEVLAGAAYPAAVGEVAEVEWCDGAALLSRVPYPLYGPVKNYLDARLT